MFSPRILRRRTHRKHAKRDCALLPAPQAGIHRHYLRIRFLLIPASATSCFTRKVGVYAPGKPTCAPKPNIHESAAPATIPTAPTTTRPTPSAAPTQRGLCSGGSRTPSSCFIKKPSGFFARQIWLVRCPDSQIISRPISASPRPA